MFNWLDIKVFLRETEKPKQEFDLKHNLNKLIIGLILTRFRIGKEI